VTVSAAVFAKRTQNLMQTRCSSVTEILTKTMTEAQEKNHTDSIDVSSSSQLGQLTWRAVEYTHQTGADGTIALSLPEKKNSHYFWVPPCKYINIYILPKCIHKCASDIVIICSRHGR
jgi:hypothetical protein